MKSFHASRIVLIFHFSSGGSRNGAAASPPSALRRLMKTVPLAKGGSSFSQLHHTPMRSSCNTLTPCNSRGISTHLQPCHSFKLLHTRILCLRHPPSQLCQLDPRDQVTKGGILVQHQNAFLKRVHHTKGSACVATADRQLLETKRAVRSVSFSSDRATASRIRPTTSRGSHGSISAFW
jgi:hypothetical protein